MNNGLFVDTANMDTQGRNTVQSSNELRQEVSSLNSNKESLLAIWKGISADEFSQAVDSQIVNLREFETILDELGTKISQGSSQFADNEENLASAAKNLY